MMQLSEKKIDAINVSLAEKSPEEIIKWALDQHRKTVVSTSFGCNSAVTLHMVTRLQADIPVIWVDSGYNVKDAYLVAEKLISDLDLNIHIYNPLMSVSRREALFGSTCAIPDDPGFEQFKSQVKLEPFQRALRELDPDIWISGIRKEETNYRKNLDIVSRDRRGIIKVSPLFNWTESDMEIYMRKFDLPSCDHYFDPTKIDERAECGLHSSQFEQGGGI